MSESRTKRQERDLVATYELNLGTVGFHSQRTKEVFGYRVLVPGLDVSNEAYREFVKELY